MAYDWQKTLLDVYKKPFGKNADRVADMLDPSTHEQDKKAREALEGGADVWDGLEVPELEDVAFDPFSWQGDIEADQLDLPPDLQTQLVSARPDVSYKDIQARAASRAADVSAKRVDAETGRLTQMGPTSFEGISTDPALRAKQLGALGGLDEIIEGGGMTMADQANLARIRSQSATGDRGRRDAILQNMRSRGMGGSGMELLAQMQSAQAATDQEAQAGLDVAAQAQERELQALLQSGSMAGALRGQDYDEQSRLAQARDAINQFNAANANQMSLSNAGMLNDAAQFNSANDLSAQQFNAGAANNMAQFNTGSVNDMARFNAGNKLNTDLANRDYATGVQQFNANAFNDMGRFNQGNKIQVGMFNTEAGNKAKTMNWQGAQDLANANTDLANKAKLHNKYTKPMSAFEMKTKKAAGQSGALGAMSDFWAGAGDRKAATASGYTNGLLTIGAAAAGKSSDERTKEDIADLSEDDIKEFLSALQPKSYRYKKRYTKGEEDEGQKVGFVMQDIEGTKIGDMIAREGQDGMKAYDPQALQGALLAAVKHLAEEEDEDDVA